MPVEKLKRHVLAHYEIAAEEGDKSLTVSGVVVAAALDRSLEVGAVVWARCMYVFVHRAAAMSND